MPKPVTENSGSTARDRILQRAAALGQVGEKQRQDATGGLTTEEKLAAARSAGGDFLSGVKSDLQAGQVPGLAQPTLDAAMERTGEKARTTLAGYAAGSGMQSDAAGALNILGAQIEQGQKELEKIAQRYGAARDENGTLMFSTQEGLNAYQKQLSRYQEDIDAYSGAFERYQRENTAQGAMERMNELKQQIYDASAEVSAVLNSGYGTEQEFEEANNKRKQLEKQYTELAQRYYYIENSEQLEKIQGDAAALERYNAVKELQDDLDKVAEAINEGLTGYIGKSIEKDKAYLKEKYGLDDSVFLYPGAYAPLSENGEITGLQQLRDMLEAQKAQTVKDLGGAGYDYERMTGYEKMLQDAKEYEAKMAQWQQEANEHPVLSSLYSVGMSPFQGIDYLKTMLGNIGHNDIDDPGSYVPLNVYNMEATNLVNAVRGTVAQKIENKTNWEIFGQNVASFLYQTGMSVADSAAQVATLGSAATVFMGASAASSQAQNVIQRGGTNKQAFWSGLAAGAAETIFEHFSIERLLSAKSVASKKAILKEVAKQIGTEASEEVFTEIANILSDAVIMGDNSDFERAVTQYRLVGMSEKEAKQQALLDCIGQVVWAGAGGALSGMAMGGAVSTVNYLAGGGTQADAGTLLRQAAEQAAQNGGVTNRTAEAILADQGSLDALTEAAGLTLDEDMTQSQRRAAVKNAVADLVGMQESVSEVETTPGPAQTETGETGRQSVQQGETRNAAEAAYDMRRLRDASYTLGESGQRALAAAYDGSMSADTYFGGFAAYYQAGLSGLEASSVKSEYAGQLSEAQRYAAYEAGRNDAAASLKREQRAAQYASMAGTDSGLVFDDYVETQLDEATADRVNEVAKALGLRAQFVDEVSQEVDANAQIQGDTVRIEKFNGKPVEFLLGHEMTHRLQDLAPAEYRSFRNYVAQEADVQRAVRNVMDNYQKRGMKITYEAALDEAAADYAGQLVQDGRVLDDFIDRHQGERSLLEKIRDAIRALVNKLTGAEKKQAQSALDRLNAALDAAAAQAKTLTQNQNAAAREGSGEVRYSAKDSPYAGRSMTEDSEIYSYDFLTALSDMQVTTLPEVDVVRGSDKKVSTGQVVSLGMENARSIGIERDGKVFVRNGYTGDQLLITTDSIRHGLNGSLNRLLTNARLGAVIGDVVQNAVPINALHNKAKGVTGTYAMAAYASDNRGREFVAIITVEQYNGNVSGMEVYDVTHAVSGRQKRDNQADTKSQGFDPIKAVSEISIVDLLEVVKSTHQSILSDDVLEHLGEVRNPEGDYTGQVLYSLKGYSQTREVAELEREVERLQEKADYWKRQTKLTTTENATLRKDDVYQLARSVVDDFGSTLTKKDVSAQLQELGEYILRGGDFAQAREQALALGRDLVENAVKVDDELYQQYSDLRNYLRTTKINVPRALWSELDMVGGYNEFRKANMGRLNLSAADGLSIDQAFKELAGQYPGFFDEADHMNPADQLIHMADVLDGLQPTYENPNSYDLDLAAEYAANTILEGLMGEDVRQSGPTFADRQAKKLEEAKAKGREAVERERARREKAVQDLKEHYADVRQRQQARRADSKDRTRLLKIAKRLQNAKLPAVNRALLDQYIGDLDTVAKSMTGETLEKLTDLQAWYTNKTTQGSPDYDPDFIPDDATKKKLARLSQRQIADLTSEEVAELTEVLLNIENELRTERKLIDTQDRRDVYHMGAETIQDLYATRGSRGGPVDRFFVTEALSPVRQLRRMTGYVDSDPLYRATTSLADGQRAMLNYQMKAERPFQRFAEDKAFNRNFSGPNAESIEITGMSKDGPKTVTITPAMRAALYLHSLNDQNLRHIRDGGVTIPDEKLYRQGKLSEAYDRGVTLRLTPSQVRSITAGMTEQERAFAQTASRYFNNTSKAAINEVSEKLKGYSLAQVENYFPINTDTSFTKADFEAIKFDGSIEGMGFLKERQAGAAAPILLRDVNAVLEQSIQQHSKYVGLAIPVRNFNKLWGVTTGSFNEDGSRNSFESSVQQAVKQQWGDTGYSYVEKMMKDLQSGATQKNNWTKLMNKVRSNYAGAVLTLNLSVAMKQAASYPTAAAVLGWRPLVRAMGDVGSVDLDLIEKYTPLQWYRSKGYSTKELGDLKKANRQLPEVLNWVQAVDVLTTRKLWKASEYYVRQNNNNLSVGSDAYYRAVADVYNRVIEETQPNYTTMQRPQLLRSDDSLLGNLAMFKTQPFQNFNILYDAAENLIAKTRQARTTENKTDLKEARRDFSRAVTSQLGQLAVFAAMTMAWAMLRGKKEKYEDEDGDMTVSSVLSALGKDMAGGVFSMVPFGSDAWEFASSKLFGETYYGMETVTVSAITDTLSSISRMTDLLGSIAKSAAAGKEINWNSARLTADDCIDDISKTAGVPYENVLNLVKALYRQTADKVLGEYEGEYSYLKLTSDPEKHSKDYYDLLYKAYTNDQAAYESIYADMVDSGNFSAEKIRSAMETRMKAAQGVTKADELEQRYLNPDQQQTYAGVYDRVTGTSIWRQASEEQRSALEDDLYNMTVGNSAGAKLWEKIDGGAAYGIDETDYLLYQLALSMVDQPTESGKLGTYTNEEVEAAIRMLTGVSDAGRSYLWTAQGKSEKSNPWG